MKVPTTEVAAQKTIKSPLLGLEQQGKRLDSSEAEPHARDAGGGTQTGEEEALPQAGEAIPASVGKLDGWAQTLPLKGVAAAQGKQQA